MATTLLTTFAIGTGIFGITVLSIKRDLERENERLIIESREHSRQEADRARTFDDNSVCQKEYAARAAEYTRQAQLCVDWKDRNVFSKVFGPSMYSYNIHNTVERVAATVVASFPTPIPNRAEGVQ